MSIYCWFSLKRRENQHLGKITILAETANRPMSKKRENRKMSYNNRPFILAFILISLLCIADTSAIRQLTTQDTSVFSTSTRLRISLIKQASTHSPDENVRGLAQIRTMGAFIIVTLSLSGLAPKTTYMSSLHAGSCAFQGPALYGLQPVVADAQGDAMTMTTLNVYTLTTTHVSINVYEAGTPTALKTPQGFSSIVCGDVKTRL
jgi:hypothetical protein